MTTKDEALKLALSVLDEVRSETFRLLRNGQKLYAEEKVWNALFVIKQALAHALEEREQSAQQRHISYVCPQCYWSLEEQPAQQQEPVAWVRKSDLEALPNIPETVDDGYTAPGQQLMKTILSPKPHEYYGQVPLYTSPPASKPWVGLTDDEICEALEIDGSDDWTFEVAYAVEAKLKEKNGF